MTIFVGENNCGKTYLASLLWGVLVGAPLTARQVQALPSWPELERWWRAVGDREVIDLGPEDLARNLGLLNEQLAQHRESMIRRVLGAETARLDHIAIGRASADDRIARPRFELDRESSRPLEERLWLAASSSIVAERRHASATPFLPASRSGLMLAYRALTAWLFQQMDEAGERASLQLSQPTRLWLASLAVLRAGAGPFAEDAEFLEREVLDGAIERREGPVDDYVYRPRAAQEKALPLHVTSSLVTELAPIVLTLRHAPQLPWFFLEEPEAHLHPKAQRVLAQVLVRMVRKGVRVVLTTHSADFCQQINNFIRLGEHPDRAALQGELGYAAQDFLRRDEVAGYQFNRDRDETEVSRLEMTPEGLVMPTFNDELLRLAREVEALRVDEPAAS